MGCWSLWCGGSSSPSATIGRTKLRYSLPSERSLDELGSPITNQRSSASLRASIPTCEQTLQANRGVEWGKGMYNCCAVEGLRFTMEAKLGRLGSGVRVQFLSKPAEQGGRLDILQDDPQLVPVCQVLHRASLYKIYRQAHYFFWR